MLNPLKWKLNSLTKHCFPTGPNFDKAKTVSIDLSNTTLQLNLPSPSKSKFGRSLIANNTYNIYGNSQYYTEVDTPNLPRLNLLHYRWAFYGPAFTGNVAEVSCVIAVMAPKPNHPEYSVFNTTDFEQYIEAMAKQIYGHEDHIDHGQANWKLPLNWKIIDSMGVPSISFEKEPVYGGKRCRFVLTPISHDRYLETTFHFHKSMGGSYKEVEAMIDSTEMNALADNIISSMHIELSEAAQAERQSILDQYPDQKLSSYVPPYKFTTPEQDAQWQRYRKIITDAMK